MTRIVVRGWVVQVGLPPEHRPYLTAGPVRDVLDMFTETRVEGGLVFPTRGAARTHRANMDDPQATRIRRVTVTLEIES
jgi:hypothetical protein